MSSEIEVEETTTDHHHHSSDIVTGNENGTGEIAGVPEESLKNDIYTAAAYGDMEKLRNLVELEGCSITKPDDLGYRALQWAALNNRLAAAQYILEVFALFLSTAYM